MSQHQWIESPTSNWFPAEGKIRRCASLLPPPPTIRTEKPLGPGTNSPNRPSYRCETKSATEQIPGFVGPGGWSSRAMCGTVPGKAAANSSPAQPGPGGATGVSQTDVEPLATPLVDERSGWAGVKDECSLASSAARVGGGASIPDLGQTQRLGLAPRVFLAPSRDAVATVAFDWSSATR